MYGTRQAASARQEKGGEGDPRSKHESSSIVAVWFFFFYGVMWGSGAVHGDDFVIVTRRSHAMEVERSICAANGTSRCRHLGQEMMTETGSQL